MKVIVRADSGATIGAGHLMRCLALAQALRTRGHQVVFVSRRQAFDVADVATGQGFAVAALSGESVDGDTDAAQTIAAARPHLGEDEYAAWVVADSYHLDAQWHGRVRALGSRVLVIDDLADRPYACDLLLDQNDMSGDDRRYAGLIPAGCRALLGSRFVLLRHDVLEARVPEASEPAPAERLLIMFAGDDPTNQTVNTLNAIAATDLLRARVDVVVSRHYRHLDTLPTALAPFAHARAQQDPPRLAQLVAGAQLCLGSAGTSAWERCYLGVPSVVLTVADNQQVVASALDAEGAAVYLGRAGEVRGDRLASTAQALWRDHGRRAAMSAAGRRLVDGLGAGRVVDAMEAA